MTPRAPTWGEIEQFVKVDGWRPLKGLERGGRRKRHTFWEKALADGRVLQTHVSHSTGKRPSPGAFSLILHEQLEVSREAFLGALRSGKPVDRPVPVEEDDAVEHEAWVVQVLANTLHMSAEEIQELGAEEAKRRVIEYWPTEKE